jgi:tRNA A-37 threonylcarbamoyl transferase component Bud32
MSTARRSGARAGLSVVADDYTLEKCLGQSAKSEIWAAVRESDARLVVLKAYTDDRGNPLAETRVHSEYTMLRAAACRGVPAVLDLLAQDPPVLVIERASGTPLAEWLRPDALPDTKTFLDIAIQLADTLAHMHGAHVIHRDVTPANIVIDPRDLSVRLVDFDRAQLLGAAERRSGHASKPEFVGTPRYVAPEQTGWLNRGCDFRSDLYSLGATLYHVLTGRPPFEASTRMELIHAHIARIPIHPSLLRPEAPDPIGRLVLKLLRKEPDERYQSARALHTDLCTLHEQLLRGGIRSDFEPGATEAPERPRFARKIHGREAECARLAELYARSADGEVHGAMLRGEAGVGKSTLVSALRPRIAETRGCLVLAKFAHGHERPYAAWIAALESLVQQILVESDARLRRWRDELRAGLGGIARALVELVPDLELVIGDVPPVPALGPSETQARLALALQRFLHVCARPERPLVIFLDDLQWADAGSLVLLEELLSSQSPCALLWIGARRSGEADANPTLDAMLERLAQRGVALENLELRALTPEAALGLLAETLDRPLEAVRSLAALVERKTANVPLLVHQFVEHIHERGFLRYEGGVGWTWDAAQIASADVPDGAVALLTAKIGRLSPAQRSVLEVASCAGVEFDVDLLCGLGFGERPALLQHLCDLCDAGLLAPCSGGFRFGHDRIRETAQSLRSPEQREQLHYDIGRALLARTSEPERAERAFEIVEHLNRGLRLVREDLRATLLTLNCVAGGRALDAGAAAAAAHHFAVARGLLREDDWAADRELAFALQLRSVESAFQCSEFATALALLDAVDPRASTPIEIARVAVQRSRVLALTQDPEECVAYMLSVLRRLGLRFPVHPSRLRAWLAMRRLLFRLERRKDGMDIDPPPPSSSSRDWTAPLLIYGGFPGVQIRVDVRLAILTNCDALERMLRYGRLASPCYSFAAFASFSYLILRDASVARRFANVALEWNRRVPDPLRGPRAEFHLHSSLDPWLMPRRQALAALPRFAEAIRELGDAEYAYYARMLGTAMLTLAGEPVLEALRRMRELADTVTRSGHRYPTPAECHAVIALLLDPGATPLEALTEASDRRLAEGIARSGEPYIRTLWMLVLCVYRRHDLALAQSDALGERLFRIVPYVHVADHTFYRGLACGALASHARGGTAWRLRFDLRRSLRRMRRWAKHGPDFVHMETLLRAEFARLRGQSAHARALYERGAQQAVEQQFTHHAALAHERHGRMLAELRRETEASAAFAQAIALYRSWGAEAKAAQLARERRSIQ